MNVGNEFLVRLYLFFFVGECVIVIGQNNKESPSFWFDLSEVVDG